MHRLLIILILLIPPVFAQAQPDSAKLKADAQKVANVIRGDKTKFRVYCEINDLGEQIGEADQKRDYKNAKTLSQQVTELEKKLGPEYFDLMNYLNNMDPDSRWEINSILTPLDESCEEQQLR